MRIEVDLSRHCIETAARGLVEELIRSYFKHPDAKTDQKIQRITRFLEQADFQALRHAMARGAQPVPAKAVLFFPGETARMEVRFGDRIFHPLSKAAGP